MNHYCHTRKQLICQLINDKFYNFVVNKKHKVDIQNVFKVQSEINDKVPFKYLSEECMCVCDADSIDYLDFFLC